MGTLSSALNLAVAGLSVTAAKSALVSRNVSYAGDENYSRRSAELYTLPGGGPAISLIVRSADRLLLDRLLQASSASAGEDALIAGLNRISALSGDPEDDTSIAAKLGSLRRSLELYETNPANTTLAGNAVEEARSVVQWLNDAAGEIASIQSDADAQMLASIDRINTLLSQFKVANDSIVRGEGTPSDLTEALDTRDSILKQLSGEIGIRSVTRPNNDIVIYAEGGAVLFEGSPRTVRMQPTSAFDGNVSGQAVYVDGVAVTGLGAPMPVKGGVIGGLARLRDEIAPAAMQQLDLIASGLVAITAESPASATSSLPDVAGLFIDRAGGLPVVNTPSPGLAARIALNPLADPDSGGNPDLLRDGGFGGSAYVRNTGGVSGYQANISDLISRLRTPQDFGQWSGIGGIANIEGLAAQTASWSEAARQRTQQATDQAAAVRIRSNEALLRVTGVNIDEEMASLLDLEKSYQASSKIISVVDAMLASLLEAVR